MTHPNSEIKSIVGDISIYLFKLYLSNDIHLAKHYTELKDKYPNKYTIEECLEVCKKDTRCSACSVNYRDSNWHSCYLFDIYFGGSNHI